MNLYIIGNGFDLFNNMQTNYDDFREYLRINYFSFLEEFEKLYLITNTEGEQIKEWKDLEEILSKWEIYDIENDVNNNICDIEDLEGGYSEGTLIPTSIQYYEDFFDNLNNYFYQWINLVNKNYKNYKNKKLFKKVKKYFQINSNEDLFFSFNYTKMLEKNYKIKSNNICYIHGIYDDESSIILGCNKEKHVKYSYTKFSNIDRNNYIEEQTNQITDGINNTISKKVLKDNKRQIELNNDFFNKIKVSRIKEIVIIGHSINEIDLAYFEEINKLQNNINWKIYYYNEKTDLPRMKKNLQTLNINQDRIHYKNLPKL